MDTDADGKGVLFCAFLQSEDEVGFGGWFAEFEAARCGDVVGGFWEEEGCCSDFVGFGAESLCLTEVVRDGWRGAHLADCLVGWMLGGRITKY